MKRETILIIVQIQAPHEGKVDDVGLVSLLDGSRLSNTTYQLYKIRFSAYISGFMSVLKALLALQVHSLAATSGTDLVRVSKRGCISVYCLSYNNS